MKLLISCFLFIFLYAGCANLSASTKAETKNVQMTAEVIYFKRNSGHYSLANGGGYLLHHSTLYIHAPNKYKGMQIKVRHPGDVEPPKVWRTIGGLFKVSVPEEFVREWKPENYEIYATAFKVLTDQSGNKIINEELNPGQGNKGENNSILLIDVSVSGFRRNAETIYYLNGTNFIKHVTELTVNWPLKYKGRLLFVTHPSYEDPEKIWMSVGARFEARIHKSYLDGQETRIDWRALKMVTEIR